MAYVDKIVVEGTTYDLVTRLEKILDSNGNPRFIEGNITPETISGVTYTYSKWSLSGSHLMIVLAGYLENGATINTNTALANISIPVWVGQKIYPTSMTGQVSGYVAPLEIKTTKNGYEFSSQTMQTYLYKITNDAIQVYSWGLTANEGRLYFRIQFDLLIDND